MRLAKRGVPAGMHTPLLFVTALTLSPPFGPVAAVSSQFQISRELDLWEVVDVSLPFVPSHVNACSASLVHAPFDLHDSNWLS